MRLKLFVELLNQIRNESVSFAFKFFPHAPEEVQRKRTAPIRMMESKQSTENIGLSNRPPQTNPEGKVQTIHVEEKLGAMILVLAEAAKNINNVTANHNRSLL